MHVTYNQTKPSKTKEENKFKALQSARTRAINSNYHPIRNQEVCKRRLKGHSRRGMLQPLTHASHRPPALRRSKEYCAKQITQLNSCLVLVLSMMNFHEGKESHLLAQKDTK